MNNCLSATKIVAKIFGSRGNNGTTTIAIVSSTATVINRTIDTLLLSSSHRYNSYVPGCLGVPPRNTVLISPLASPSSSLLNTLQHHFGIVGSLRAFTSTSDIDSSNYNDVESKVVPEFTLQEQELLDQHEFKRVSFDESFVDIAVFEKWQEQGLCKQIDGTFCQDNRDYEYHGKKLKQGKIILLNQILDTELVNKRKPREPIYHAMKNGEILVENTRQRRSKNDIKGKMIGWLPNKKSLERVVRVLPKSDNGRGYNFVWLKGSHEAVGTIVLATFVGNRPPGMTVDHMNRHIDDNRVHNLRWITWKAQRAKWNNKKQSNPLKRNERKKKTDLTFLPASKPPTPRIE